MSVRYARLAERHWRRWLPTRVAKMTNPGSFFSELGEQAATQIADLTFELAGNDPPGEKYMQKLGRLQMARVRAEEVVLPELVLLPPEPGLDTEAYPDLDEETPSPA